jgi:excisionase family DNA binding protein
MMKEDDTVKSRDFVTTTEAAQILGVSYYTVYEYIREKRIVAELVGGVYLMPRSSVEQFKPKPTGRTRTRPTQWRTYRAGAKVRNMDIRVQVREGQQELLMDKLEAIREQQQHLFPGTMQRYVFVDEADPSNVQIMLIWKNTDLPDEAEVHTALEAFEADFSDVLDWDTAQYTTSMAIIHT